MKLYGYFRSSAAYRVRIAFNLKKIPHETAAVHLTRSGGVQFSEEFRAINPQKRVPALALSTGETLIQSLAIIEYLDEIYPEPPLLPADAIERAQVRAFAQIIACDIHPLNNLVALNYLKGPLKHDQAATDEFHPEKYKDHVRDRIMEQIERKVEGKQITEEPEEAPKTKVLDLMQALKQSLGGAPAEEKEKPAKRRKVAGKR